MISKQTIKLKLHRKIKSPGQIKKYIFNVNSISSSSEYKSVHVYKYNQKYKSFRFTFISKA